MCLRELKCLPDVLISVGCSWLGHLSEWPQQFPVECDSQDVHCERQGTMGRGWVGLVAFLCYNKEPYKKGAFIPSEPWSFIYTPRVGTRLTGKVKRA